MKILSIETSCDETSIAIVEASGGLRSLQFKVLKNIVSSQILVHRPFGGVVPNLAKREHIKNLPLIYKKIKDKDSIDAVAVTVGPGLSPALWTGITYAKEIAQALNIPLLGANHMEGHLYSNWLKPIGKTKSQNKIEFPAVALVVSGGHTILLVMQSLTKWKKLGETRDDAAGEAFDKVARMLKLPYPGGPEIQKIAMQGKADAIAFPRPMLHAKNSAKLRRGTGYDFSFSGLKTSVLYYLRDNSRAKKADIAASFQEAVVDVLSAKTMRAAEEYGAKSVLLCGGVSANKPLRERLKQLATHDQRQFFVPPFEYNTDNAAMIATAAYIGHLRKKKYRITAQPNLNL